MFSLCLCGLKKNDLPRLVSPQTENRSQKWLIRIRFHPPAYTFQMGISSGREIVWIPFYLIFKVVTIEKLDTFKSSLHNRERQMV
jgi:hypothetical protein